MGLPTQKTWENTGEKVHKQTWYSPDLTATRSSDTWNEPYAGHAAVQREPDHTSHAPPHFSSPPPQVNNELPRVNTLVNPADYHDTFGHLPHDPLPADTDYRRPSRELPAPNTYQPAEVRGTLPQISHIGESTTRTTTQPTIAGQQSYDHTPQQPYVNETDYQAIETDSENDDAAMSSRRLRPAVNSSPVDFTQSPNMATASASQQSRTRKRSSTSNGGDEGSAKKRTKRTSMSTARVDAEDLQDEAPSAEDELLQAQQREALKMQETNKDEEPVKIGQRTCIICLENYTNATTAICGKPMRGTTCDTSELD